MNTSTMKVVKAIFHQEQPKLRGTRASRPGITRGSTRGGSIKKNDLQKPTVGGEFQTSLKVPSCTNFD